MNISAKFATPARDSMPVRDGVGIVLVNTRGEIWLGQRRPRWLHSEAEPIWQMPQGGLLAGELPLDGALRELAEETGASSFEPVAALDRWLSFELPDHMLGIALKGRYRGQRLLWFAVRFTGTNAEFCLRKNAPSQPEFEAWTWAAPDRVTALAVPWKHEMYSSVLTAFRDLITQR